MDEESPLSPDICLLDDQNNNNNCTYHGNSMSVIQHGFTPRIILIAYRDII